MTRMMKDSGVEWIGEIPENWDISNIGQLYSERKEKVDDINYSPLSVTMKGILPQLATAAKSDDHENRKHVCINDFVINSRSDRKGSCGISELEGSVSLINTVLIPHQNMSNTFYGWLFHSCMFSDEFYKWGHGIVDDLWTTKWQDMKKIQIPLPPESEQDKIAAFLDEKCGAIDEIISKTEQSIEEYKKLKQSVITKAVTKGIRPNRPMQDSNIEWIGEIPADWEIKRFRYIADKFLKGSGITKDDVKEDGNIKCVRYGEIYSKYNYTFNDCLSCTNVEEISTPQYFSYGDLLFAGTGELIEEIGKSIVYLGNDKCLAGGDIIVVKHRHNPAFLNYTLNSDVAIYQKSRNKIKLKVVHISAAEIKNIIVPLPPLEEQKEIAQYLEEKCAEIDTLIEKKQQFLAEMANYKKSLIYEYVTGKKEVA